MSRNAPEDDGDLQSRSPFVGQGHFSSFPSQTLRWFAMGALFSVVVPCH